MENQELREKINKILFGYYTSRLDWDSQGHSVREGRTELQARYIDQILSLLPPTPSCLGEEEKETDVVFANRIGDLINIIKLILPMAKGYAYKNNVGANVEYIRKAEETINESYTCINKIPTQKTLSIDSIEKVILEWIEVNRDYMLNTREWAKSLAHALTQKISQNTQYLGEEEIGKIIESCKFQNGIQNEAYELIYPKQLAKALAQKISKPEETVIPLRPSEQKQTFTDDDFIPEKEYCSCNIFFEPGKSVLVEKVNPPTCANCHKEIKLEVTNCNPKIEELKEFHLSYFKECNISQECINSLFELKLNELILWINQHNIH